jgi:divalent metal cation (Fe/Co/Zn/Cd) transporter
VAGIGSAAREQFGRGQGQASDSVRAVSMAFLANFVVAVAKWIAFFISGSSAILAESVHSTAVTINQALLLEGQLTARRPATRLHPFGFGQARYFWAFVVGIRQPRKEKGKLSYWQYIQRSKNPEVPVVVLEDSAALVGLFFAYLGIGLALATGYSFFDAAASILIGLLLATISFVLAREMRSLLLGEAAPPEEERRIRDVLAGHAGIEQVVYLRSMYIGPDDLLVEAKVRMDSELRAGEVSRAIDEMEAGVREQARSARIVAIETGEPEAGDPEDPGAAGRNGRTTRRERVERTLASIRTASPVRCGVPPIARELALGAAQTLPSACATTRRRLPVKMSCLRRWPYSSSQAPVRKS